MIVELLGVLEDGSNRAAAVPQDERRTVNSIQGAALTVRVRVVFPSSVPATGFTDLVLTIRQRPERFAARVVTVVLAPAPLVGRAVYEGAVPASAFQSRPSGMYFYDVWARSVGVPTQPVVRASPWHVAATPGGP
jgi:hypothetical protein